MGMGSSFVISMVINFVMRQLGTYTKQIKWSLVKSDLHERIKDIVPSLIYDQTCGVVDAALDGLQATLENTDQLRALIELLANNKLNEAGKMMQELLAQHFEKPKTVLTAAQIDCQKALLTC